MDKKNEGNSSCNCLRKLMDSLKERYGEVEPDFTTQLNMTDLNRDQVDTVQTMTLKFTYKDKRRVRRSHVALIHCPFCGEKGQPILRAE